MWRGEKDEKKRGSIQRDLLFFQHRVKHGCSHFCWSVHSGELTEKSTEGE